MTSPSIRMGYAFVGIWLTSGLIYLITSYAPATADSYAYLAATQSFFETGRFTLPFAESIGTSLPVAYAAWPPGLPALLSLFHLFGLDVLLAARTLSALSALGAVLVVFANLRTTPGGPLAAAVASCCCMTLVVAGTAWSEGPFLLALCALWVGLVRWLKSDGHQTSALYLALIGLTLAPLFRNAGLFCVPVAVWTLVRGSRPGQRRRVLFMTGLALLPAGMWLVRNTVTGLGARGSMAAPPSWWRAVAELPHGLGSVALFPALDFPWAQLAAGTVILTAAGVLLWRTRPGSDCAEVSLALWIGVSLLAGTLLSRITGLIASPITDRLVWPAWFLLSIALTIVLTTRVGHKTALACMVAYLVIQGGGIVRFPAARPRPDMVMNNFQLPFQPASHQSFVSNEAWRVWWVTGASGYYLPRRNNHGYVLSPDTLRQWASRRGVHYVVWLADGLSPGQSRDRYGPLGSLSMGKDTLGLRLVHSDALYHTYQIAGIR